jgi:APA family basic amino acid/polyamine antiporter
VIAALTILLVSATNYLGIRPSAIVQNTLTVAKVTALGGLIVLGMLRWTSVVAPDAAPVGAGGSLINGLAVAFPAVLFTIGGWQQMNMVAGEVRDPERTIPRALMIGIGIVIVAYLGANAVYLHVLGPAGLAASSAVAGDAAARLVGPVGGAIIRTAAMLSILGLINVVVMATPRIFFMMARDGVFPGAVSSVHPRFGSPHLAIVVMAAWSLVLLIVTRGDIGHLISGVVFADWIFFALGGASVIALRRSRPDARRPYRVPGYPLVPAFFLIAACVGIVSSFVAAPALSVGGTVLLGVGAAAYFVFRKRGVTASAHDPRP